MQVLRMSENMIKIGDDIYVKLEICGKKPTVKRPVAKDHKSRILGLLEVNGELSFGVIVNRCRGLPDDDASKALDDMVRDGLVSCRVSLHPKRKCHIYHYSLTRH